MTTRILTQDELKSQLHYNHETGIFIWIVSPSNNIKAGSVAGGKHHNGYIYIKINYKTYSAHRLAWLYMTGRFPLNEIDHRNGIKDANWISNLKDVTHSENLQNKYIAQKNNKCGILGVSPNGKNWRASIRYKGKTISLGTFKFVEQAHSAYLIAKRDLHENCNI